MERIVGLPVRGLASDLQIRTHGQVVQSCPGVAVVWADIPALSSCVCSWPWSWQQFWQQSSTCLQRAFSTHGQGADLVSQLSVSIRDVPLVTVVNGTVILMPVRFHRLGVVGARCLAPLPLWLVSGRTVAA